MRYIVRLALVASLAAGLGCDSSSSPSGTGSSSTSSSGQGTMGAVINSLPWTANGVTAAYSAAQSNSGMSILTFSGQDSPPAQTLAIAVGPAITGTALTTGTYQVGVGGTNAVLTLNPATSIFQANAGNGSGSVTLTTFSTTTRTAAGTFNFVMPSTSVGGTSRTVTSGTFSFAF